MVIDEIGEILFDVIGAGMNICINLIAAVTALNPASLRAPHSWRREAWGNIIPSSLR